MAILTKADLMAKIKTIIGDDTSDETLNALDDITDTIDDYENRSNGNASDADWQKKYDELDAKWRQKYKDRFFSTESQQNDGEGKPGNANESNEQTPELKTSYEELFK